MTPRARSLLRAVSAGIESIVLFAFPLLVFGGVSRLGVRTTALVLCALLLPGAARALASGRGRLASALLVPLSAVALLALAATLGDGRFMLLYPVLVNAVLLLQFALSLRGERSLIETLARLRVPDLSPEERRYCRSVTRVWCAFFVVNGGTAAILAALGPRAWWAIYTGGISYALVGAVFAAEYVVRKARFGRFGSGPVDRLLAPLLRSRVANDP